MNKYNLNDPSLFLFYDKNIHKNINSIHSNYSNTNLHVPNFLISFNTTRRFLYLILY